MRLSADPLVPCDQHCEPKNTKIEWRMSNKFQSPKEIGTVYIWRLLQWGSKYTYFEERESSMGFENTGFFVVNCEWLIMCCYKIFLTRPFHGLYPSGVAYFCTIITLFTEFIRLCENHVLAWTTFLYVLHCIVPVFCALVYQLYSYLTNCR